MQDFPANSHKAKARSAEPKKLERVTSAEAVRRKRGLGRQFKDTFISGDAKMAVEYIVADVVVPTVRDMMFDAFQGGLEKMIYGESRRPRRGIPAPTSAYPAPRVNYAGISNTPTSGRPNASSPPLSRQSRTRQEFGELVIQSRTEANEVIDRMFDILTRYGTVAVADLYELTGIQAGHTDYKWGWTELHGAKASPLRNGGFLLDLPEPQPLG